MTSTVPNPLLACRDLRFSWGGQGDMLDLPDFEMARGERVFVCGPSGSGKSTLLGLLAGVLTPVAGSVHALGRPLSALRATQRDRFRADHVGYIFQQFNLLPYLSLIDNVLLGCRFSTRRTRQASTRHSARAEAEHLLRALGLDTATLARRTVNELSVGQQQRVAAARALIGAPELIIADEPTSALDTDARNAFVWLLLEQCSRYQSSLVFVSHDASLASNFDRTLRLYDSTRAGN